MRRRTGAESPAADPLDTALPFGVALGHRVRQVREESARTANEVAGHARTLGLGWGRSTVTHIELGQRQVTAAELLMLPLLYDRPLSELLPTEPARLTGAAATWPEELRWELTRPPRIRHWSLPRLRDQLDAALERLPGSLKRMQARFPNVGLIPISRAAGHRRDEATAKAARRLGADRDEVAVTAEHLWGRGLAAERDRRLAKERRGSETPRARQARRGHITRTLLDELRPAVKAIRESRGESGVDT